MTTLKWKRSHEDEKEGDEGGFEQSEFYDFWIDFGHQPEQWDALQLFAVKKNRLRVIQSSSSWLHVVDSYAEEKEPRLSIPACVEMIVLGRDDILTWCFQHIKSRNFFMKWLFAYLYVSRLAAYSLETLNHYPWLNRVMKKLKTDALDSKSFWAERDDFKNLVERAIMNRCVSWIQWLLKTHHIYRGELDLKRYCNVLHAIDPEIVSAVLDNGCRPPVDMTKRFFL